MAPGVDPHLYQASQGDLRRLAQADVIFYNGLNLEGRLSDVLARMGRRTPTYALTEYMSPGELLADDGFGGVYDPHVWFDVSLWVKAVERVRDAMVQVDPPAPTTTSRMRPGLSSICGNWTRRWKRRSRPSPPNAASW